MKMRRLLMCAIGLIMIVTFSAQVKQRIVEKKIVGRQDEQRSEAWGALQFFNTSRAFPFADIPPNAYENAYRFYKTNFADQPMRQTLASSTWQNIGPNNIGGRTLAIAFDPNDTSIIWLGSASGGLWKSTTGGTGTGAWSYIPTGFPVRGVSCIAIDPSNSAVMYIGTGETYSYGTSVNGLVTRPTRGTVGIGLLKSTDGGATWTQSLNWSYNQLRGIWDIIINPLNPAVVYAATTEGVYKTNDAGGSWTNVLAEQMVMDLEIDRVDTNIVYAGVGNVTSPNKGIYKTTNSGTTWTRLTTGLPANTNQGRTTITAYPGNNKVLFALIADLYSTVGVYRSLNAGVTWAAMNTTGDIVSYQGWYAKGLCVKSDDSSQLLFGGVEVFHSGNSGIIINQVSNLNFVTDFVHSDIHEIISNPLNPDKIYVLTDGGLFRSDDFGVTFYECTDGYVTSQFYIGAVSYQDSLMMLGGAQDNYTSQYTGTVYWTPVVGGDGSFNAIDRGDDNIQYCSYQYLNIVQSFDRGVNWNYIFSSPSSATASNPAAFVAPFVLCPSNTNVLYAGGDSLHKSIDQGFTWNVPSNSVVQNGSLVLTIAVSSTNADSLYLATVPADVGSMHVFRSVNGGVSFTDISTGLPNRYPRDIAVNPDNSSELYIVYSGFGGGHIFKSNNAGATWTDVSTSLPDVPFHTLMIEPEHTDTIFAGSDLGVFASYDGGASWTDMNIGLPDGAMIFDLEYSPVDHAMVAFTHGNGVYKISLDVLPLGISHPSFTQQFTQQIISNPVHGFVQLALVAGKEGKAGISMYDVNGKKVKELSTHYLTTGKNLIIFDASQLSNGTYFLKTEFNEEMKVSKMVVVN